MRSCSSDAITTSFGYEPSIPPAAIGKRSVKLRLRNAKAGTLVATDRGRVTGMRSPPRSDVSEAAAGLRLRELVTCPAHGLYKARVLGVWLYPLADTSVPSLPGSVPDTQRICHTADHEVLG